MLRSLKTTASCIALAFAVSNAALAADHMTMVPASAPSVQSNSAQVNINQSANTNQQTTAANAKVADNNQDQTAEKRSQSPAHQSPAAQPAPAKTTTN